MPHPTIDTSPAATRGIAPAPLDTEARPAALRGIEASAAQADFRDFMASLPISLSPAMIMAMLQRRMNGLDSQISAQVSAMETQQAKLTELQENAQIVMAVQAAAGSNGEISASTLVTIGDETKSAQLWLEQTGVSVAVNAADGDHRLPFYTPNNLKAAGDSIAAEMKLVNQGTELKMMDLQSLMQQRSSEISLATNMLKSVQDGTDAIVRNIG